MADEWDKGHLNIGFPHHPLGRAYSNFYEVMDMQADIISGMGVASSIADNLTRTRKAGVSRRVAPANHFRVQDAARILNINTMNIHTPADNHVKKYQILPYQNKKGFVCRVDIFISLPCFDGQIVGPYSTSQEVQKQCVRINDDIADFLELLKSGSIIN